MNVTYNHRTEHISLAQTETKTIACLKQCLWSEDLEGDWQDWIPVLPLTHLILRYVS